MQAGHVVYLTEAFKPGQYHPLDELPSVENVADDYLGTYDLSFSLFTASPDGEWPWSYANAWTDARTKRDRAKVAASLLRAIAQGEVT